MPGVLQAVAWLRGFLLLTDDRKVRLRLLRAQVGQDLTQADTAVGDEVIRCRTRRPCTPPFARPVFPARLQPRQSAPREK